MRRVQETVPIRQIEQLGKIRRFIVNYWIDQCKMSAAALGFN